VPLPEDDRADQQVELVDQTVRQQVVPQGAAAEHQDLPAVLPLQLGDLPVRVGAADDPGVWRPGSVSSGVRLSDTTTLSTALSSREISRWSGVKLSSSATRARSS
jgi:hypothetical protein